MANTYAVDFDLASSEGAYITDNASLSITGDLTCEAWVKIDQLPSTAASSFCIMSKWDAGVSQEYLFYIGTDDKLRIYYDGAGSAALNLSDAAAVVAADVGYWRHFACALDVSAQTTYMYKDGKPIASSNSLGTSTDITDGTANFAIGCAYTAGSTSTLFDGRIDDARIWTDIRTASEIESNFHKELNGNEANLVGYWRLENNYLDETSNDNDLTAINTPTFETDPAFTEENTYSLDFTRASSELIYVSDAAELSVAGDFSIEAWIYQDSQVNYTTIVGKDDAGVAREYKFLVDQNGDLRVQFFEDATHYVDVQTSDQPISVSTWCHVALTCDVSQGASGVKFYVNGTEDTNKTTNNDNGTSLQDTAEPFIIGANQSAGANTNFFDGKIDEVRLWGDVRTATEIASNYRTIIDPDSANLNGYWRLENNLADLTDYNNKMTQSNTPVFSTSVPPWRTANQFIENNGLLTG